MPAEVFVITPIITGFMFVLFLLHHTDVKESVITIFGMCVTSTLFITAIIWAIIVGYQDWRVDATVIKHVGQQENIQFIVDDLQQSPELVNVNKEFNQRFDVGDKIKIIKYQDGPYAGIYVSSSNKYEIVED